VAQTTLDGIPRRHDDQATRDSQPRQNRTLGRALHKNAGLVPMQSDSQAGGSRSPLETGNLVEGRPGAQVFPA
jgi:hypothetical protein